MKTIEEIRRIKEIKNIAKAVYLFSDIGTTMTFLESVTSEEEADRIILELDKECANVTVAECKRLYKEIEYIH